MNTIVWLRKDLRLHDNTALAHALLESDKVYPIFILDEKLLFGKRSCDARNYFLKESLKSLEMYVSVFEGEYIEVLKKLIKENNIERIYINKDYSPYSKQRDKKLDELGVEVKVYKDAVIFEGLEVNSNGKPYSVFTPYRNKFLSQLTPLNYKNFTLDKKYYNKIKSLKSVDLDKFIDDSGKEIYENSPFKGSEIHARKVLDNFINEKISQYKKERDFPSLNATSQISAYLHFGLLSIRECFRKAMECKEVGESWINELIWREFYFQILDNNPHIIHQNFNNKYKNLNWEFNENKFIAWKEGKTGYPIVDAAMRCLNKTGWMHNRLRMIVASFLTKDLHIDWRLGENYFMNHLIDMEVASNNGGWQWSASTGADASPFFRVFSPIEQQKKFDHENRFIEKWIPELNTPDYPKPIIDHKIERVKAINLYKDV